MKIDLAKYHRQWVDRCQQANAYHAVFWIMADHLDISWASLHQSMTINMAKKDHLDQKLARYMQGEPEAYIIGHTEFMGLDFQIKPGVLIPREDTSVLVHALLPHLQASSRVMELGVGSGAISCVLAHRVPGIEIIGVEREQAAIDVASENIKQLVPDAKITLLQQSWSEELPSDFDVLVSNPPYIDEKDPHLSASVRSYEPKTAWCSGKEGYQDLFDILEIAKRVLRPGGWVALEHGFQQQAKLVAYGQSLGFDIIDCMQDQQGKERGVLLRMPIDSKG